MRVSSKAHRLARAQGDAMQTSRKRTSHIMLHFAVIGRFGVVALLALHDALLVKQQNVIRVCDMADKLMAEVRNKKRVKGERSWTGEQAPPSNAPALRTAAH